MPATVPHTGPYDSEFDDPLFDVELDSYDPEPDECSTAVLAHLSGFAGLVIPFGSVLGPALIYYTKREESAYVEDQAREALNFHLTAMIAAFAFSILSMILIGIPFLLFTALAWLVLPIKAAMRANRGERYRYPLTYTFVS